VALTGRVRHGRCRASAFTSVAAAGVDLLKGESHSGPARDSRLWLQRPEGLRSRLPFYARSSAADAFPAKGSGSNARINAGIFQPCGFIARAMGVAMMASA
jgi:hypothetical protein